MNVIEQGAEADRPKSGLPLSSVLSGGQHAEDIP